MNGIVHRLKIILIFNQVMNKIPIDRIMIKMVMNKYLNKKKVAKKQMMIKLVIMTNNYQKKIRK